VGIVAQHVGDGRWLAPSVLRVQAFLELPFTMFAYLAVARLLGRRLHASLCRLPVLFVVGVSFSVTFSIIELALPNPYTRDDLALRALAALTVPVYVAWVARRERLDLDVVDGPSGVLGLLSFLAGAGAVAYVVLAVYDAFLLYNLAHLPRYAGRLAVAVAVTASAGVVRGLRCARPSMLGGAALVLAATAALFAAGWATKAAFVSSAAGSLPELVLARVALSFLAVAIVVFRGVELAVCWAAHETKAPADEA